MIKRFTLFFASLFFLNGAFAQTKSATPINSKTKSEILSSGVLQEENMEIPSTRTCGTMDRYLNDPVKMQKLRASNERAKQLMESGNISYRGSQVVVTIPVVVHVVYNTPQQNISDAQINSQIQILNEDFRKLNADINLVPSVWTNLAADIEIEFCLASRDPQGNPTNGITRTQTGNSAGFNQSNAVKSDATGGKSPWNTEKYLNIWVCKLAGSLLGYAQFPDDDPATDGVVIGFNYFGNTGTAQSPFNKGRTTTHEIGHWLGLFHIWGDEPQCSQDDEVSDTPQQKDSNSGCPNFPQTTQAGGRCNASDPSSMFMNYMDYVNDACMYMFTNGQKARMLSFLNGSRASLLTSDGCIPPGGGSATCDSTINVPANGTASVLNIYNTVNQTWGYVSGHNSYLDIGKAEKFNVNVGNMQLSRFYIGFGRIYASNNNSTFSVKVYNTAGNGGPGSELVSGNATYAAQIAAVNQGNYSLFTLNNPISVPNPFFIGVEFGYTGDTLAIYTTALNQATTNTGWEKLSDNTWQPYTTPQPAGWALSFNQYIVPVFCSGPTSNESAFEEISAVVNLFPNPAQSQLMLNLSDYENYTFTVVDLFGREIDVRSSINQDLKAFDISSLPNGMYFLKGVSSKNHFGKSFIVNH